MSKYLGAAPVPTASTAYTTKDTLLPSFTLVDEGENTGTANVWRLSCQVSTFWRDCYTWFGFISNVHNCAWQQITLLFISTVRHIGAINWLYAVKNHFNY